MADHNTSNIVDNTITSASADNKGNNIIPSDQLLLFGDNASVQESHHPAQAAAADNNEIEHPILNECFIFHAAYHYTIAHTLVCRKCYRYLRRFVNDEPSEEDMIRITTTVRLSKETNENELQASEESRRKWLEKRNKEFLEDDDIIGDLTRKLMYISSLWLSENVKFGSFAALMLRHAAARLLHKAIMTIVEYNYEEDENYIKAGDDILDLAARTEGIIFAYPDSDTEEDSASEMEMEIYYEVQEVPIIQTENDSEAEEEEANKENEMNESMREEESDDESTEDIEELESEEELFTSAKAVVFAEGVMDFVNALENLPIFDRISAFVQEENIAMLLAYAKNN